MPEAAVDKYHFPLARKDYVWATGEILSVQPKAIAKVVKQPSHVEFRRGVNLTHFRHGLLGHVA